MSEPTAEEIEAATPAKRKPHRGDRNGDTFAPDPHRMLPANADAEQGVLCSFLLAPREVGPYLETKGVTGEWFHVQAHEMIFTALHFLWSNGTPPDFVILTHELLRRGQFELCGGGAYISGIFTFLPTAANVEHYAGIMEEMYQRRQMITVCTRYAGRAYSEGGNLEAMLSGLEMDALKIRLSDNKSPMATAKEAVMEAMNSISEMCESRGHVTGLSTGFHDLDKITDGLHKAEMIVIAARPSMGKSALAMNIAEHIAVTLKKPIAIFSLEMSKCQLMTRMICSRSSTNLAAVREGLITDRMFSEMGRAASILAESKMFIDQSSSLTIQDMRGRARKLKADHGIEAIFVDYLQLVRSFSRQAQDKREREISEISSGCKEMARELDLPVVVLAQLGRDIEKRGPQSRPRLSDLRESGAIEQDADTIGFLTREEFYAETEEEMREVEGQAELFIAKQRMGPRGTVKLTFLKEYCRFESAATHAEEEQQTPQML